MKAVFSKIIIYILISLCLLLCACGKTDDKPPVTPTPQATPTPVPEQPGLRDYNKGLSYYDADGVERNFEKALDYFLESANAEYIPAMEKLAYMYEMGLGTPSNPETAGLWFSVASQKGSEIAKMYIDGVGHLNEKAVHSLLPADAVEEYELGMSCFYGIREKQDYAAAYRHFEASAELGCGRAYYGLGVCALHGKGTEQSLEAAAEYFEKSLELGCLDAADKLVLLYAGEFGGEPDEELEQKWRQRRLEIISVAAEMGYEGYMLEASETALADGLENEAQQWYRRYFDSYKSAYEKGEAEGLLAMAVYYNTRGSIVASQSEAQAEPGQVSFQADPEISDPDLTAAIELLEHAADRDDSYAAQLLWSMQLEDEEFLLQQISGFVEHPEYLYAINSHYWLHYTDASGNNRVAVVYIPACAPGETTQIKDRFSGTVLYELKLQRRQLVTDLTDCITGKTSIMQGTTLQGIYPLDNVLAMYEGASVSRLFGLWHQFGEFADFMHGNHPLRGSLISLKSLAGMYLELIPEAYRVYF